MNRVKRSLQYIECRITKLLTAGGFHVGITSNNLYIPKNSLHDYLKATSKILILKEIYAI